ncbi:hypothetical protein HDU81_004258 [Chytriomyces hyalinus]|nr:hypothetical protein HDU81_004258 [Chytriomyces hyalinus]
MEKESTPGLTPPTSLAVGGGGGGGLRRQASSVYRRSTSETESPAPAGSTMIINSPPEALIPPPAARSRRSSIAVPRELPPGLGFMGSIVEPRVSIVALQPQPDNIALDPTSLSTGGNKDEIRSSSMAIAPFSTADVTSTVDLQANHGDDFETPNEDVVTMRATTANSALIAEAEEAERKYEMAKASGMRRKTILLDLHDLKDVPTERTAALSRAMGMSLTSNEGRSRSGSVVGDHERVQTAPGTARSDQQRMLSVKEGKSGASSSALKLNRSNNPSKADLNNSQSQPSSRGKHEASVKFADEVVTTPPKHTSMSLKTTPSTISEGSRRPSFVVTPPQFEGTSNKSSSRPSAQTSIYLDSPARRGTPGASKRNHAGIEVPSITVRQAQTKAVNVKPPAGPNMAVLAVARARCHDRNSGVLAMVGAYDPCPLFWPGIKEEKERRSRKGIKKDVWDRCDDKRFQPFKQLNNLGPGSYDAPPRIISTTLPSCTAFKSSVPRFQEDGTKFKSSSLIGPGSYSVEVRKAEDVTFPWVKRVVPRLGRIMEPSPKLRIGTDMGMINLFKSSGKAPHFTGSKKQMQQQELERAVPDSARSGGKAAAFHPLDLRYFIKSPLA